MNISVIKSVWDLKQVHRVERVTKKRKKTGFYFYFGCDLEHSTHKSVSERMNTL